ncbi:intercellular adhesion protein [Furfurilactobacillus siliginis]|nr:intercellular adhesion protein [Furfurilactobacillus siliginis]
MMTFTVVLVGLGFVMAKNDIRNFSKNAANFAIAEKEIKKRDGLAILNYHRIIDDTPLLRTVKAATNNNQLHEYNITTQKFAEQMTTLKKAGVKFVSLAEAERLARNPDKIKGKYVAITFDDVAESAYQNAFPILKKQKIPFACFVISSKTNEYVIDARMTSWPKLVEMEKSGLATIGLHTHDMHYLINDVAVGKLGQYNSMFKTDYRKSKQVTTQQLATSAAYFAAPYGNVNDANARFLEKNTSVSAYFNLSQEIIGRDDEQGFEVSRVLVNQQNWSQLERWAIND